MNNKTVTRIETQNISKAVGNYTHITKIEPGATLYTFSGQIGADLKGNLPVQFNKQVENTFKNIDNLLKSVQLTPDNIVKINIWATQEIDWDYFYQVYDNFFGKPSPSMTVAYITALGLPEIKLEIEIMAAK